MGKRHRTAASLGVDDSTQPYLQTTLEETLVAKADNLRYVHAADRLDYREHNGASKYHDDAPGERHRRASAAVEERDVAHDRMRGDAVLSASRPSPHGRDICTGRTGCSRREGHTFRTGTGNAPPRTLPVDNTGAVGRRRHRLRVCLGVVRVGDGNVKAHDVGEPCGTVCHTHCHRGTRAGITVTVTVPITAIITIAVARPRSTRSPRSTADRPYG